MADQAHRAQPKFRRVVTGHDVSGKPIIWIDGEATNHKFPDEHISSTMMWSTTSTPYGQKIKTVGKAGSYLSPA